jgi:hypothetical protein
MLIPAAIVLTSVFSVTLAFTRQVVWYLADAPPPEVEPVVAAAFQPPTAEELRQEELADLAGQLEQALAAIKCLPLAEAKPRLIEAQQLVRAIRRDPPHPDIDALEERLVDYQKAYVFLQLPVDFDWSRVGRWQEEFEAHRGEAAAIGVSDIVYDQWVIEAQERLLRIESLAARARVSDARQRLVDEEKGRGVTVTQAHFAHAAMMALKGWGRVVRPDGTTCDARASDVMHFERAQRLLTGRAESSAFTTHSKQDVPASVMGPTGPVPVTPDTYLVRRHWNGSPCFMLVMPGIKLLEAYLDRVPAGEDGYRQLQLRKQAAESQILSAFKDGVRLRGQEGMRMNLWRPTLLAKRFAEYQQCMDELGVITWMSDGWDWNDYPGDTHFYPLRAGRHDRFFAEMVNTWEELAGSGKLEQLVRKGAAVPFTPNDGFAPVTVGRVTVKGKPKEGFFAVRLGLEGWKRFLRLYDERHASKTTGSIVRRDIYRTYDRIDELARTVQRESPDPAGPSQTSLAAIGGRIHDYARALDARQRFERIRRQLAPGLKDPEETKGVGPDGPGEFRNGEGHAWKAVLLKNGYRDLFQLERTVADLQFFLTHQFATAFAGDFNRAFGAGKKDPVLDWDIYRIAARNILVRDGQEPSFQAILDDFAKAAEENNASRCAALVGMMNRRFLAQYGIALAVNSRGRPGEREAWHFLEVFRAGDPDGLQLVSIGDERVWLIAGEGSIHASRTETAGFSVSEITCVRLGVIRDSSTVLHSIANGPPRVGMRSELARAVLAVLRKAYGGKSLDRIKRMQFNAVAENELLHGFERQWGVRDDDWNETRSNLATSSAEAASFLGSLAMYASHVEAYLEDAARTDAEHDVPSLNPPESGVDARDYAIQAAHTIDVLYEEARDRGIITGPAGSGASLAGLIQSGELVKAEKMLIRILDRFSSIPDDQVSAKEAELKQMTAELFDGRWHFKPPSTHRWRRFEFPIKTMACERMVEHLEDVLAEGRFEGKSLPSVDRLTERLQDPNYWHGSPQAVFFDLDPAWVTKIIRQTIVTSTGYLPRSDSRKAIGKIIDRLTKIRHIWHAPVVPPMPDAAPTSGYNR